MSREDPQLRIRLPIILKEKIEIAAKQNNRSMNAEIVHRLNTESVISIPDKEALSAQEVLRIAKQARAQLPNLIYNATIIEIRRRAALGHTRFEIDLVSFELNGFSSGECKQIIKYTIERLEDAGFIVHDSPPSSVNFIIEAAE